MGRAEDSQRYSLHAGAAAIAPLLPSVIPFGMTAGVAAREAGLGPLTSLAMSILIFAGAAQLATLQLLAAGALPLVIVATALIINLRFAMYSASLAPFLSGVPRRYKWPMAYMLTDQAYAVVISRLSRDDGVNRQWFYLGAAVPVWLVWQAATVAGIALGGAVPASWQLRFAVPLIFLALLVPAVHDRPTLLAAVAGGGVAALAAPLPLNLGLIAGALSGIATGMIAEAWQR